jgi:hypothetical protein
MMGFDCGLRTYKAEHSGVMIGIICTLFSEWFGVWLLNFSGVVRGEGYGCGPVVLYKSICCKLLKKELSSIDIERFVS